MFACCNKNLTHVVEYFVVIAVAGALPFAGGAQAAGSDWTQFRGPGALGRSDAKGFPLTWSDDKNIVWKAALPGPGASSPITFGNKIFLTCFTGFATSSRDPG